MRILELQRRLREVGRIRIGQQVAAKKRDGSPTTRPVKLDKFRLTSRDELVIRAAAEVWGGTCQQWDGAPDGPQWEVFTETNQMAVVVPPGDMAFSQAYEQWSAGGCKVRCDGQRDHIADKPCHCDPEARACDIHSRLSVILPDLPGMGVWRLDTQGYYAAVELGGLVDLLTAYTERGVMLPARLRLEQRTVKRPKPGGGGVETKSFAVPVLDVDVHPLALTGGVDGMTGEIAGPLGVRALPAGHLTPVPAGVQDGAGAPSIADQVASAGAPVDRPARANAATPIPATGVKPRTAQAAEAEAPAPHLPAETVEDIRSTLNVLGVDARRAFLNEFGRPPAELLVEQVDAAVRFVERLAAAGSEPSTAGDLPQPSVAAGATGEGVDDARAEPTSTPDLPSDDRPGPTYGVKDVAKLSTVVFRSDYDAAPKGEKTKIVDRLRHALVYAQTAGRAISLNDLTIDELIKVDGRLRNIQDGQLVYSHDDVGVTFVTIGGDEVLVTWAQVDGVEVAA